MSLFYDTGYGVLGKPFFLPAQGNQGLDPPDINFAFSFSYVPDGLICDSVTGHISGTPTQLFSGIVTIIYSTFDHLFDQEYSDADAAFTLYVISLSYSNAYYRPGSPFTLNITQNGTEYSPTNYSILPSLPAGLTINPTTGTISGTPVAIDDDVNYVVTVTVPGGDTYDIDLTLNGVNVTYNNLNITANTSFEYIPTVTGEPDIFYLHGDSDPLPDGITLNEETGELSGITTDVVFGLNIIISYDIGSNTYSASFTINVASANCLCGDARVLTLTGYKAISDITTNDHIISDHSIIRKVKSVYQVMYTGSLYYIKKGSFGDSIPYNNVFLSPNHKFIYKKREYRPRNYLPKINVTDPILLYHIELDNPTENIIVEGIPMESHHPHIGYWNFM